MRRCSQAKQYSFLSQLACLDTTIAKVLISCRAEDKTHRALAEYPSIQLTATAVDGDIKSFVEGSVTSRIEDRSLKVRNTGLVQQIVEELHSKARGM